MLERLARPDVDAWIVEADGEPVGYLQVHADAGSTCSSPVGARPRARARRGRAMTEHLLDERGWTRVTVDPYTWNEQALRAWRKAGFVAVSHHRPTTSTRRRGS